MSLDVFGVALQRSVLEEADLHDLVGSTLGRRFPELSETYPALRLEAEEQARAASIAEGCPALAVARITDHLEQILSRTGRGASARAVARDAIHRELELEQIIGRAAPDAVRLHEQARDRGIATAMVTDSYLPRDLIARMLDNANFKPDHLLVASNEGVTKESGLFDRLLDVARVKPERIIHFGADPVRDVAQPAVHGIHGVVVPGAAGTTHRLFELGLTRRSGIDSIALALADGRFRRRGPLHSGPQDVGYYAGGPLAAGFAAWVGRQIDDKRPQQVLFCGPAGALVRRVTTILRPDLPQRLLTSLPTTGPGAFRPGELNGLDDAVHAESGSRVLVVETGLDGQSHPLVQEWAIASGRSLEVNGAYLVLRRPDRRGDAVSWAPGGTQQCSIEQHLNRRPEIVEALLGSFPTPATGQPVAQRSLRATSRELEAGVIGFAEDFRPWVRFDHCDITPALVEPALRVISDPTPAEASILGPYPGSSTRTGVRPVPLATVPRYLKVVRGGRRVAAKADAALWPEGFRALTGQSSHSV